MMPAERVSGTVPVGPDARAQPPRLSNQLLAHHRVEIFVHDTSLPSRYERRLIRFVRRTLAMSCGAQRRQLHGLVRPRPEIAEVHSDRDNRDADLAVVPKANMLSDKCRDVRPWWGRRLYAAPRRGPRLVGQSSFQKANQRDAVTPRVVDGPSLKAVGRKEDGLVRRGRPFFVRKHLHVLTLDGTRMILALHQHHKLNAQLAEAERDVDAVLAVMRADHLLLLKAKV